MVIIKNLLKVVFSNLIVMGSSVAMGLILPMFLSVMEYGNFRLFYFYLPYIGFLHLGFIDAIFLKYGGDNPNMVDLRVFKSEHRSFLFFQIIFSAILSVLLYFSDHSIYELLFLSIVPLNMVAFHRHFYQATGQFNKYAKSNILQSVLNLIFIGLLLLIGDKNSYHYIWMTIGSYIILFILLEIDFYRYTKKVKVDFSRGVRLSKYFRIGIFILAGNLSMIIINNIGLWIVDLFFKVKEFAYYSFSISMMSIILVVVSAVGITFYHYFAEHDNTEIMCILKSLLLIFGTMSAGMYFFFDFIVHHFLPTYTISLQFILISFISLPFLMVINIIIINLYKARKLEKKYFKMLISMLIFSFIIHLTFFVLFNSLQAIMYGSSITYIVWFLYTTTIEFPFLRITLNETFLLSSFICLYLITTTYFHPLFGGIIYYSILILLISLRFKETIKYLIDKIDLRKFTKKKLMKISS